MENLKSDAICLLLSITESSDLETKQIIAQEINYSLLIKATTGYINDFFKKNKLDINQQHIQNLLKIRDEDFLDQGGLSDCLNLLIVVKVLQRSSGLFNLLQTEYINVDILIFENFLTMVQEKIRGPFFSLQILSLISLSSEILMLAEMDAV